MIDKEFQKIACKVIYEHKSEFENYLLTKSRLHAVKALKDYTGAGLKECKDVLDLYFDGKLPSYIIEERRTKLEMLAKKPLVEELYNKLISLKKDDFGNILMNLTVDELLNLDEIIDKNILNK